MTDIEAIKKAWTLVEFDLFSKEYITNQSRHKGNDHMGVVSSELVDNGLNKEDAEKIAYYICEHFELVE